ncbi:hypothetical protein [Avibacterium sp. 21-594]|uniref:hypothetical protein n=1 Tax=Avibacterium sp. 21-594 TaxID=2911535 RepID=UPI0022464EE1|nr:hypothetical protein [Avibacterium sp. 21-594]MCW9716077.1 hypothetical protein [Avibacterium sp. 21-594]
MEVSTKIIFIYAFVIILLILFTAVVDKHAATVFFNKARILLQKGNLNEISLTILIKQTKVKRYYVSYMLRRLYLITLTDDIKEHQSTVLELLLYYEREIDLVNLPNNLKEIVKLLQKNNSPELIKRLTDSINSLYLSDKNHKRCNLILGGASFILAIASVIPELAKFLR